MNAIAQIRKAKGLRQLDIHPDVGLFSRVENNKCLLPPKETLELAQRLDTAVDKLYPDKSDVVIPYPPSRASVRRREREREEGIEKLTLRVPAELANRFRELCKGHMQAEVFEIMVIKMEKDRRHHHMASGQGDKNSERKADNMTKHEKHMVEGIMERNKNRGTISIGEVFALAEMAKRNIYPDGTFSDDACLIWEDFKNSVSHKEAGVGC